MTERKVEVFPGEGEILPSRKTYASPQLVIYGNISQITRAVGKSGALDGAPGMGMNKAS